MWKELNIPNVFTIEASFLGPSIVIFSSLVLWSLD